MRKCFWETKKTYKLKTANETIMAGVVLDNKYNHNEMK